MTFREPNVVRVRGKAAVDLSLHLLSQDGNRVFRSLMMIHSKNPWKIKPAHIYALIMNDSKNLGD
jgi:hypothetical protein